MNQLMSHLVYNFPKPTDFNQLLEVMLEKEVDFLEIQMPFTHPVGDGQLIYDANQEALKFNPYLGDLLKTVSETKQKLNSKTQIILMGYLTPILNFGLEKVSKLLRKYFFYGAIIPDLNVGSNEYAELNNYFINDGLNLIPVISPLTTTNRLKKIKSNIQKGQIVYATARKGQTGIKSDLEDREMQDYFNFLKKELTGYQIAVGFGIKDKKQVVFLNQQGFVAVIGSEFVKRINIARETNQNCSLVVTNYLESLGF